MNGFQTAWSLFTLCAGALLFSPALFAQGEKSPAPPAPNPMEQDVTQGALRVKTEGGVVECPLKHTDVTADISGFIARVKVTQTFRNPLNERIEAVYVFPLPHTAAVDDMTMVIGDRRIVGVIKRRAEARAIYEEALLQGLTASLLEQERPNIFTQSVGNIKPGQEVRIEISYVDVLKYDMGTYEFHFPMVVGPRYKAGAAFAGTPAPAAPTAASPGGAVPAAGVNPPVLKPGFRTGHDISLSVRLDAGVPIQNLKIVNHRASVSRQGETGAEVSLSPDDAIPNKDFVMKYGVVGEQPEMALLAHSKSSDEGYFMLMIQPRIDEKLALAPPRELVFLVDVSGSMSGAPTEKVKETMRHFFKLSKADDTIQVVTFAGRATKLFEKPVPATEENVARALNFTQGAQAGGGTEMLQGIRMALGDPVDPRRVRIIVMLTDGYIGNEAEIIAEVGKRAGDQVRFWALGIGSSPNRFLIDGVAKQGGGKSAVIELTTDPEKLVHEIVERIHRAQLGHIQIDWKGLYVYETYPRRIPELWAGSPVILFGRYWMGGTARITISGTAEGEPLSYDLEVALPTGTCPEHSVLAQVWARQKIEDLMAQVYYGDNPEVIEEVTRIALEYRLMSQYTSFVAVDESDVANIEEPGTPPKRLGIPVPLPEGVSFEGIFGLPNEPVGNFDARVVYQSIAMAPAAKGPAGRPVRASASRPPAAKAGAPSRTEAPASSSLNMPVLAPPPTTGASTAFRRTGAFDKPAGDAARARTIPQFQQWSSKRHEEAVKVLAEAQELQKKGDLDGAMLRFQHALLLETAWLAANPWNDRGTAGTAAAALESLLDAIPGERAKARPALAKRLDLVIRDRALSDVITDIGNAAGVTTRVLPGSLEDAAALSGAPALRVTYLDLRRATVAQALTWLLAPNSLTWRVEGDTILVGTARRLPGASAWTYAVVDLAAPAQKELPAQDQPAAVARALQDFLAAVRLVIGQRDEGGMAPGSAVLMDPTRLLVYGDKDTHARIAALLLALQRADGDLEAAAGRALTAQEVQTLRSLQKATSERWAARAAERDKAAAVLARARVAGALDTFSWQLLAGASAKSLDEEALAELRVAFTHPRLGEVAAGADGWVVPRSAWAITQAARLLPGDADLQALADIALQTATDRLPAYRTALEQKPDDAAAYLAGLYSVLAFRNARALQAAAPLGLGAEASKMEGLLLAPVGGSQLSVPRVIAASLLLPTKETDAAFVKAISDRLIGGDDLVALAHRAAQQRGAGVWQAFREEMPGIVGAQRLDGNVVLIVNSTRLARLVSAQTGR